jgi:transposase
MKRPKYYVGIDISSANFAISAGIAPWQVVIKVAEFENNQDGFQLMLAWLEKHGIQPDNAVLCMEATGVYGENLAYFVNAQQYDLAIEPPLKVKRAFMPQGHKNDRVDSQQIAEYSYRFYDELVLWQPREEVLEQIKVLLATREQFVVQKTAHSNILHALKRKAIATPLAEQLHHKSIQQIKQSITQIDDEIKRLIDQDPKYGQMIKLLMTVPGVGMLLATQILLIMENDPNRSFDPKQLAAYIGICPYEHRSGSSVYRPASSRHYGPATVRKLLYLASLSVRTHNPTYKKYFLRKVAEGKPKKLVLNNIANKLLNVMCAVVRSQTPYIPTYRSVHPSLLQNA